jgi:hypothetical protein
VFDVDRYRLGRVKLKLINVFLIGLDLNFRQYSSLHNLCLWRHPNFSDRQETLLLFVSLFKLLSDVSEQFLCLLLFSKNAAAHLFFDARVTLIHIKRLSYYGLVLSR